LWFVSPRAENIDKFCTNIFMPTGPGTVGETSVSLDDITDDHATTILLLCYLKSDVHWHEPRDIHISEFARAPGDPQRILFRGELFQGANAAMVDGSVRWLPADLKYDTLLAMLTITGGETVDAGEIVR
jgi:prepilin-type processing-associated H-X9-DG protein